MRSRYFPVVAVLLSLPGHREVGDVVQGAGVLTRGLTIIDTTTGDPASARSWRGVSALAGSLAGCDHFRQQRASSSRFSDADGRGDAESFDACSDIFEAIGRQTFHTDLSARARR